MGKFIKSTICIMFLLLIVIGCSKKVETFVIPENYTAEVKLKAIAGETENEYKMEVTCLNESYNFKILSETGSWNIAFKDEECIMYNEKFTEASVTINNFKLKDSLINEFDLKKFDVTNENLPQELVYYDGNYKHVLKFNEENMLPKSIFIYKNDNLVKAIQYEKINVE